MCDNNLKNAEFIAEGANGKIYKKNNYVIKNKKKPEEIELNIQSALYQVIPEMIIKPLGLKKCDNGRMFYYMDYVNGKDLLYSPWAWNDANFRNVILAILKLKSVYPTFRHNDLHLRNIMVTPEGSLYIVDFGLANIRDAGPLYENTKINQGYEYVGIHPHNDTNYDYHLFLNSLWLLNVPELQKKIEKVVPQEYLGMEETEKISQMRLKLGVDTSNFPTVDKILKIFQ